MEAKSTKTHTHFCNDKPVIVVDIRQQAHYAGNHMKSHPFSASAAPNGSIVNDLV